AVPGLVPNDSLRVAAGLHGLDRLQQPSPQAHDADVTHRQQVLVVTIDASAHAIDHGIVLYPGIYRNRVAQIGFCWAVLEILAVGHDRDSEGGGHNAAPVLLGGGFAVFGLRGPALPALALDR